MTCLANEELTKHSRARSVDLNLGTVYLVHKIGHLDMNKALLRSFFVMYVRKTYIFSQVREHTGGVVDHSSAPTFLRDINESKPGLVLLLQNRFHSII